MVEIFTASEKDIPTIEDILVDAVRWLDSIGQPLWREDDVVWGRLSKNFDVSDFRIALLDGKPAACMAVVDHDPILWPEIAKGESLFIHKLAVKRFAAGKGLSGSLISYAKTMCMDKGISMLRLECHSRRPKLRAVYERNGFSCVAEKIMFKIYHTAFYECAVHDTEHLYHYHEKSLPPFLTLTTLPFDEARDLLVSLNTRIPDIDFFLTRRYEMEKIVRDAFVSKGGRPANTAPVYMTLGANKGLSTWFREPAVIKIPVCEFDPGTVSFTYGDTFPVFKQSLNTGEEWWGKVYFYDEILALYKKYGLPENPEYHMTNGVYPKDKSIRDYLKYIEAHVWNDEVLNKYR